MHYKEKTKMKTPIYKIDGASTFKENFHIINCGNHDEYYFDGSYNKKYKYLTVFQCKTEDGASIYVSKDLETWVIALTVFKDGKEYNPIEFLTDFLQYEIIES